MGPKRIQRSPHTTDPLSTDLASGHRVIQQVVTFVDVFVGEDMC